MKLTKPMLSRKGFSLIDSLLSGFILSIVSLVVISIVLLSGKIKNKSDTLNLMLILQEKFYESSIDPTSYLVVDSKLKDPKSNSSGVLPTIPLKIKVNSTTNINFNLEPYPKNSTTLYFDKNFNNVGSSGKWLLGIEAQYQIFFKDPLKNMVNYQFGKDLYDYRIALRIFANNSNINTPLKNISSNGQPGDTFSESDFSWIISKNLYSRTKNSNEGDLFNSCTDNSTTGTQFGALMGLSGFDKESGRVYCTFADTNDCGDPQISYLRSGSIDATSFGYHVSFSSNCIQKAKHLCPGNNYKVQSFDSRCYFDDGQCSSVTKKGTCVIKYPHETSCSNIKSMCGQSINGSGSYKVCPKYYSPASTNLCGNIPKATKKVNIIPTPCMQMVAVQCKDLTTGTPQFLSDGITPDMSCTNLVSSTCNIDSCASDNSFPDCYSGCNSDKHSIKVTKMTDSTCWTCANSSLDIKTFQCAWDNSQGKKEVDDLK